jgi:hypothetical protein
LVLKDCPAPALFDAISKTKLAIGGRFGGIFAVIFTKTMPFNGDSPRFRRLCDLYHKTK